MLNEHNYSEVISLLIDCKDAANEFMHFNCVQSLQKKLQETLYMTEIQLDSVLNEVRTCIFIQFQYTILIYDDYPSI